MSRGVLALACVAALACRGNKPHRTADTPAVQVVTQPQLADAAVGSGETSEELEPNDSDDTATRLPLTTTMRGKIDPETDVDRYRIDVDRPGELALTLSGGEGQLLVLELEDANGLGLAKSNRAMTRVKEGIPNFGVLPGRYFAVVHAMPRKKPKPPRGRRPAPDAPPPAAAVYELSARMVDVQPGFEQEPNDDRGTANDVVLAQPVSGFVGWNNDEDVWKLSVETLSTKNAIDVEVSAVEGVALEVIVSDALGTPLVDRKAPRGAQLAMRGLVPVVPAGGSPYHYITVRGAGSNPETAYQLRIAAHVLAPDSEIEPDDSPDKPYTIPADRTVVHATWTPGDVDCFAVTPASDQTPVSATIEQQGALDLSLEMLVDGKSVGKVEHGKGGPPHVGSLVLAGSRVVFCVRGSSSATAEGTYDLLVRDEP